MKDKKKIFLNVLKKHLERADKFESLVMELALNKKDGSRDDGWGVYYSKSGKRLISAKKTIEGDYVIKDDTEEIGDNAFWGCAFLRRIAVPASVKTIDPFAFASCDSLKKVTFRKLLHLTVESDTLAWGRRTKK